jgi:hypothetical protein
MGFKQMGQLNHRVRPWINKQKREPSFYTVHTDYLKGNGRVQQWGGWGRKIRTLRPAWVKWRKLVSTGKGHKQQPAKQTQASPTPQNTLRSWAWWCTPLIPALGRQRQEDFWVRGQPGLQSEFQDSQGYTENLCLGKTKNKPTKQKPKYFTSKSSWPWSNNSFLSMTLKAPMIPDPCPIKKWQDWSLKEKTQQRETPAHLSCKPEASPYRPTTLRSHKWWYTCVCRNSYHKLGDWDRRIAQKHASQQAWSPQHSSRWRDILRQHTNKYIVIIFYFYYLYMLHPDHSSLPLLLPVPPQPLFSPRSTLPQFL